MTSAEMAADRPHVWRDCQLLPRVDCLRLACCDLHGQANETIACAAGRTAASNEHTARC